jgi:putative tryptophan/tyrosine transport system substrate-binding protein
MEYRYANNQLERLPALAAELVGIPAAVIITSGGPRPTLVAKAATTTIPIVFAPVPDPVRGGLVASFNRPGGNITGDSYRQVGLFTARIFKGEKPADLPVQQPTKFELIVNLRTAKALGLTVPLALLGRADEVIE